MFTGIIETTGKVTALKKDKGNLLITIQSNISHELKVDQSIAHDGVCLTATAVNGNTHTVTAVTETLDKSNLGTLKTGYIINLERSMKINDRLDGHIVQGHVDQTAICKSIEEQAGSWFFTFQYQLNKESILVNKGSVTINGISLTVVDPSDDQFSVAIIPYTFENTNFKYLKTGERVNMEMDIIGKYVARLMNR